MTSKKPILIVWRRDAIRFEAIKQLGDTLYRPEYGGFTVITLPTEHPEAEDIRVIDLGKLTKAEYREVVRMCKETVKQAEVQCAHQQ